MNAGSVVPNGAVEHSSSRNRPLYAGRRLLLFGVGIACYLLSLVLARLPGVTETIYGNAVGAGVARALSLITGVVPLALSEFFVLALIARQLIGGSIALRDVRRGRRQWTNAIQAGALRVGQDLGILVALFYLLWGFNYARAPLQNRLGWSYPYDVTAVEVADLAAQMVSAANDAYLQIHSATDAGEPTRLTLDANTLERVLDQGWEAARLELGMPPLAGRYGRAKTPLLTFWYERTGIAGFYFPFTAEANLRAGIPAVDNPKMLAHEKAHQRGVARESEANFWGFLSAAHSKEPEARYSAFVFAQRQLLAILVRMDRDRAGELAGERLPGVQRDIDDSRRYWRSFRGRGTEIGRTVNDAYLRSNRVEGGVHNYSMSTALMIAYARAREGMLEVQEGQREQERQRQERQ